MLYSVLGMSEETNIYCNRSS